MRIEVFRTVFHNAVELQGGVLVDVDVREPTLFGYCEELLGRVYCYGADAIRVLAHEHLLFMCVDVVYLIGIARCENDHVLLEVVHVEPLHGCHTVAAKELLVAPRDRRVRDDLLLVALRIVLVDCHGLLGGNRGLLLL